mgnify:CR=1 FL=1
MAKSQKINTEEEGKFNNPIDAENDNYAGTPTEEVEVTNVIKKVRIRATEDIDCLIACQPVKVMKDKEATVASDVAAILCFAGKAYRL